MGQTIQSCPLFGPQKAVGIIVFLMKQVKTGFRPEKPGLRRNFSCTKQIKDLYR